MLAFGAYLLIIELIVWSHFTGTFVTDKGWEWAFVRQGVLVE
jgi:hypothetical protein